MIKAPALADPHFLYTWKVEMVRSGSAPTIKRRTGVDKYLFLAIVVGGGAGIIWLKALREIDPVFYLAWPLGWMGMYLLLVTKTERFRLREDQAGDNIYYLGFLYTLTSLSVALYYFNEGAEVLSYIITNFGIALTTTIAGVTLRVVLHQMREDPIDTERDARQSLLDAATRLREELDASVRDFNSFRRQTQQSIEEALEEMGETANRLLEKSCTQVGEVSTRASGGIEAAFAEFTDAAKQINQTSHRTVKAAEKLIDRIEGIDVPADLIERKIAPASDRLAELAQQIAKRDRADDATVDDLRRTVGTMSDAANEMLANARAMRESVGAASSFSQAIEGLLQRLNGIDSALSTTLSSVTRISEVHEQASQTQVERLEEQARQLNGFRESLVAQLEEFRRMLSLQTEASARETQDAMGALAKRQSEVYDTFAVQAQQNLLVLQENRKLTEAEVAKTREATQEVLGVLASMVNTLAEHLAPKTTRL